MGALLAGHAEADARGIGLIAITQSADNKQWDDP